MPGASLPPVVGPRPSSRASASRREQSRYRDVWKPLVPKIKNNRRLFCFGDLCLDLVARTGSVPETGQDATVEQLDLVPAGAAVNCAITAARHGADVELIGIVGQDAFGAVLIDHLSAAQVGTSRIARIEGRTGVVISVVQPGGERTLYSYRGVNASPYGTLPSGLLRRDDCLYVSGYSCQTENSRSTAVALMSAARSAGALCALDPSFQFARDVQRQYPDLLKGLDFLFPNREEAALITGSDSVEASAAALHQFGAATVIVTLGDQGCYVHSKTVQAFVRAATHGSAVDTTGAGDAFCGAFLASFVAGINLIEAALAANAAAGELAMR